MKFKAKNLNVFKPTTLALILVALAALAMFGVVPWFGYALWSVGQLTFSVGAILTLALAGGVLLDAKK